MREHIAAISKRGSQTIRLASLILLLLWCMIQPVGAENQKGENRDAIVKIYTVNSIPDYFNPWRMLTTNNITGSGCIIHGNRILTNAHVVANQTFIQVRRYGQAKRYNARVLSISHEADLALLTVEDESFFSGVVPLKFGPLPETQQEVLVYGFPFGGDSLSVTKGVLSRIEHRNYVHSSHYLLAGQIDAAINPGNSGGPVLVRNRVVGVVMQSHSPGRSENIGYMVPTPVIKHFLKDIEDGRYDGFPKVGLATQKVENPDMKRKYGLSETLTGVVVNHIFLGSPAETIIKKDDILLAVDGHPIGDDGTLEFRPKERTNFTYYVDLHQMGENVNLKVLREGEIKEITLALSKTMNDFLLVPMEQYDQGPRYFIFGGIVFSPLTKNYLKRWGKGWQNKAPKDLIVELSNWTTKEKREIVVATQVLAADINKGYHDFNSWTVTEVNGQTFKDFNEFFNLVTTSEEPFMIFKNRKGFQIVIDREEARESHESILQTYRIKEDRSPDMIDLHGNENK